MKLTPGSVTLTRDLHCWQMSFTWVPIIGFRKSWNFNIRVKSGMLSDLKYEKSSGYLTTSTTAITKRPGGTISDTLQTFIYLMRIKHIVAIFTAALLTGCTDTKNENPLLGQWDTPHNTVPFSSIKLEHYRPAVDALVSRNTGRHRGYRRQSPTSRTSTVPQRLSNTRRTVSTSHAAYYST